MANSENAVNLNSSDIGDVYKIRIAENSYFILDSNTRDSLAAEYKSSKYYHEGDFCFYGDALMMANADTTGTYNPSKWDNVTEAGGLANVIGNIVIHTGGIDEQNAELEFPYWYFWLYPNEDSLIWEGSGPEFYALTTHRRFMEEGCCIKFGLMDVYSVEVSFAEDSWTPHLDDGFVYYTPYNEYDATSVQFRFSRIDGAALSNQDYSAITSNLELRFRRFTPDSNLRRIQEHLNGEYTEIVKVLNCSYPYDDIELSDTWTDYPGARGEVPQLDYYWSEWFEEDSGLLFCFNWWGVGDTKVPNHYSANKHVVAAVYEYSNGIREYVGAGSGTYQYEFILRNVGVENEDTFVELPETALVRSYQGNYEKARLVAYRLGFEDPNPNWRNSCLILKKPKTAKYRTLEKNDPEAVRQFLRLIEESINHFIPYEIIEGEEDNYDYYQLVGKEEYENTARTSASLITWCLEGWKGYYLPYRENRNSHYPWAENVRDMADE